MKKMFLMPVACILLLSACNNKPVVSTASYFDKSTMDTSVNPADDFFSYANGAWVKGAKIPDDQSTWGGFDSLQQENIKKLRTILEEASAKTKAAPGSPEQMAGDFYASGLDTNAIEKAGYNPIKPLLAKIDAAKNYTDLLDVIAENVKTGDDDLIGWDTEPDQRNSAMNIVGLGQTGTSLPEKGYYTRTDSNTANLRRQLVNYAAKLFELTGTETALAQKEAGDILMLETLIAKSHKSPVELRDPVSNYHKMSLADLQKLSPNINWKAEFEKMGIVTDSVDVGQPEYYKALSSLLAAQPLQAWKNKIRYDFIVRNSGRLSKAFRDERFKFQQLFSGEKKQLERWKEMVEVSDYLLKDVLGQLYVQKYFPPDAKKRMDDMVNNLQKVFNGRIERLAWMGDSTKQKAKLKLSTILKKIGYPDKWKKFDDVKISRDNFYANLQSLHRHEYNRAISKIGKPVDRTEWDMTAPTVNAYYNPLNNEIVFPAGILQFPFFEYQADDAINYGGIGVVIGHEMTHGFDDEGRQFDEKGNLKDWWTAQDGDLFKGKTAAMIGQFDKYPILDSMHVNGALTLGENIADLGGVNIAYEAFKLTPQGKDSTTKIDGFTSDQRFFLGFAQVWRMVMRPEIERTLVNVDPHSPAQYRVNGTLSDFTPFYTAFGVTEKNKLYRKPEDRLNIW